jgi:hypothetical protein
MDLDGSPNLRSQPAASAETPREVYTQTHGAALREFRRGSSGEQRRATQICARIGDGQGSQGSPRDPGGAEGCGGFTWPRTDGRRRRGGRELRRGRRTLGRKERRETGDDGELRREGRRERGGN